MFANFNPGIRLIDLVDIGIVAFIFYRILLLIKGTRAMQMVTGLGILGIAFFISSRFELFTTHWFLSYFFDYLILIVIVLFQDDLRRALTHVGRNPFSPALTDEEERAIVDEIARAATRLANDGIGALMVIEREAVLRNFVDTGSKLDARVRSELLYSIFLPTSPIHDGAVIVSEGRIAAAGCFLPLSKDSDIDKRYGTRHRAALGLTEEYDAIVVLVSEESQSCHLVKDGKITPNLEEAELRENLVALMAAPGSLDEAPRAVGDWISGKPR